MLNIYHWTYENSVNTVCTKSFSWTLSSRLLKIMRNEENNTERRARKGRQKSGGKIKIFLLVLISPTLEKQMLEQDANSLTLFSINPDKLCNAFSCYTIQYPCHRQYSNHFIFNGC